MSEILSVYSALAGRSVPLNGTPVRTLGLADLKNTVDTALLPCRLLLPLGTATEGRNFGFIALGRTYSITWQVVDLFLYKAAAQGLGVPEVAETLISYAGAYVDMLQGFRAPTAKTYIEDVTITPGMFEWPSESGKFYTGVEVLLQITEVSGG